MTTTTITGHMHRQPNNGYRIVNLPALPDDCKHEDGWRMEGELNTLPTPGPEGAVLIYDLLSDAFVDLASLLDLSLENQPPGEPTHVAHVHAVRYRFDWVDNSHLGEDQFVGYRTTKLEQRPVASYYARVARYSNNETTLLGGPIARKK